jgi:hypothetical protein
MTHASRKRHEVEYDFMERNGDAEEQAPRSADRRRAENKRKLDAKPKMLTTVGDSKMP